MEISVSSDLYTPIYAITNAVEAIFSTCYKIIQYISSLANQLYEYAFNSNPKPVILKAEPVKKLSLPQKLFIAAAFIGCIYYTNAIERTYLWLSSFVSTSSCISYYGDPATFAEAKAIFRCNTSPRSSVDPSKGWDETKKTFRLLSKFSHPDKGGGEKTQFTLNKAKELMEYAYTTEEGQRDLKIYECISRVPIPTAEYDIANARKIFECAGINSYKRCYNLGKEGKKIMNQISWIGGYAQNKVAFAWNCICHWN